MLYFFKIAPPEGLIQHPNKPQGLENLAKITAHNAAFAEKLRQHARDEKVDDQITVLEPLQAFSLIRVESTKEAMEKLREFPGVISVTSDRQAYNNKKPVPAPR